MTVSPCRSGRHLRDDADRDPGTGHRRCLACTREARIGAYLVGHEAGRWATPVAVPERHEAWRRWADDLPRAILILRLTEGHDGDRAWRTLGEFLEDA